MLTLLAWSPVLLLFFLAVFHCRSALTLAVWGIVWTGAIALLAFQTPFIVVLLAALDGLVVTVPLLLVVFGGILLASVLIPSGSLARLGQWFTQGVRDEWDRVSLLALGLGNGLEGAGIIAEPVAAPMLRASGIAPMPSAALSVIGYSGLMTLGLGGVIVTVLSGVTGFPTDQLAYKTAILSIPASVLMAWCIPFFTGRSGFRPGRLFYLLLLGSIAGLGTLAGVMAVGYQVGELSGGAAVILFLVIPGIRKLRLSRSIMRDAAPLLVMGLGIVLVNSLPGVREIARSRFSFDLSVIPGRSITFRPLADAYLYLFLAFAAAHFLHDRSRSILSSLWRGSRLGWRTILAMALFGGMGQILSFSGWDLVSGFPVDQAGNIPRILAESLLLAGPFYIILVPFLGWVGTFLTGYGVASIMLFATLQIPIAGKLGMSPEWLVCGLAVGASIGGISSPFKIAFAASMCGAAGMEGKILRKTIPMGIAACLLLGSLMMLI